jgi:hypothetical protein
MADRREILYVTGVLVVAGAALAWIVTGNPATARSPGPVPVEREALQITDQQNLGALAQRDPMALVRLGRERYEATVREYRCVLVKQELLATKLSPVQEVELRYRESPRAVYMIWKANAEGARRALYIDQSDFVNEQGQKLARVEPAGAVVRLLVKDIFLPMHGPEARKASRRALDEAGFRASFELLEAYNAVAAQRGVLDLRYGGIGSVDGRPTYVIVRDLPYDGPTGAFPDARMVLHLDQEWLLPVAIFSYADHAETALLGSYVFSKVELNPGFDEEAFKF